MSEHDKDVSLSYSAHCNSVILEPTPTQEDHRGVDDYTVIFPRNPFAHVTGGAPFLNDNSSMTTVTFGWSKAYRTRSEGVIKVEVTLDLKHKLGQDSSFDVGTGSSGRNPEGVLRFVLSGYLHEETGDACMVGFGYEISGRGVLNDIRAVFKMKNFKKKSSIVTSLITATMESLGAAGDSSYFQRISLLMFNQMGYEYGLVLKENGHGGFDDDDDDDVLKSLPLPLGPRDTFCSIFSSFFQFELLYPGSCDSGDSTCSPIRRSNIGFLPRGLMLTSIACDNKERKFRVLFKFSENRIQNFDYSTRFDQKTALIGEGIWDGKKNQLQIVACNILSFTGSAKDASVQDCSVRLSFRIPAAWSLKRRSQVRGKIWSRKPTNDSDYFDQIVIRIMRRLRTSIEGLKYDYSQLDHVRKSCKPSRRTNKSMKDTYPDGDSDDMSFSISVKTHDGKSSFGYSSPLFVGDHMYAGRVYTPTPGLVGENNSTLQVPVNISYTIRYQKSNYVGLNGTNLTTGVSTFYQQSYILIVAEGIYDPRTGALCMIGCRRVGSVSHVTVENYVDCEIAINFQLPSRKSRTGYVKGSIVSTRKSNDSLYFERLELISSAYTSTVASENIWRMDFEIILVIVSNTLACVFVAFQLVYVTRRPQTLPFASLMTLAVLALGYLVPLLLNFEASFMQKHGHQNVSLESGKWIEVNEALVRVVTMVAFLLQFRLVQLTWSSRVNERTSLWAPEIKCSLYVILPIYIIGALATCVLNWQKDDNRKLLGDLKSYAGLILNSFLLPQILLNIFSNTKEKTLSEAYYIGTTFVRLLPHAYDLLRLSRDQNAGRFERSYMYANHDVDFYSLAWDVAIPFLALGFAAVIFIQQRFGGRSVLPRRFREDESYEKVPAVIFEL